MIAPRRLSPAAPGEQSAGDPVHAADDRTMRCRIAVGGVLVCAAASPAASVL